MGEIYFDMPAKGFQEALPIGNEREHLTVQESFRRNSFQARLIGLAVFL